MAAIRPLSQTRWDADRIKDEWPIQIEDVLVNSWRVHDHQVLREMADDPVTGFDLPVELRENMDNTDAHFQDFYDEQTGAYFSRDTRTQQPLGDRYTLTIASLAPIVASQVIGKDKVDGITQLLDDPSTFQTEHPVPTTALNHPDFDDMTEHVGGINVIMNTRLAIGLEAAGHKDKAKELRRQTIEVIEAHGFAKGYSPLTGQPIGSNQDSIVAMS